MTAQSGKLFKETLCESRAHPVDSSDPTAAKTIDELKKLVSRHRAEIESERSKFRELEWSHEREVRSIREDAERKLERSLDALARRKDDERLAEVEQTRDRLLKQNQQELRTQRVELEEEMKRLERRLTREREESMRKVLDLERKKTEEELSHYLPEDSVASREEHLKAEIFRLGVEVERLEFQMSNLQRENREQINLIKKTDHQHKLELENLRKKNQADAARDLAQLKLAEQIIQEKERHIQEEEYRVDMALMEKEVLAEELAGAKSRKTLEALGREEAVQSPTSGKRLSMPGGVLQRRVEELETAAKKLDEERRQLKQENASLRKAAVKEGGGEGDGKATEEKLKRLRKRNAELVALARQLDDKTKSLKLENDQLKASVGVASSVVGGGGGGDKGKGGGVGEGDPRRMSLSRQHAKDISEYTKQLLAKERELESTRTRLSKYEVNGKARYEPAPEMERRVRSMAMERLRMEKVMVQLYSKASNPLDVGQVTKQEMADESQEMEKVFDENKSLREELDLLRSQARMEEVDNVPQSLQDQLVKQRSVPAGGRGAGSERERQLSEDNSKLKIRVAILVKCEMEVGKLQAALQETESAKTSYEQQNRRLTQQLKQAQQLAQEMDAVQEMCEALEKEAAELKGQMSQRDSRICQLEKSNESATESLSDARQETDSLRGKVGELEEALRGKQDQIKQLASELDSQPSSLPPPPPPLVCDVSLQTSLSPSPEKPSPPHAPSSVPAPRTSSPQPSITSGKGVKAATGERRVKSAGKSRRIRSPVKRGASGEADVSLDNEMRLAGVELTDSYDSSEGVGFSDTNLDGSSLLLSLEEEGARREVAAGGEGGGATRELPHLAWVAEAEKQLPSEPASDETSESRTVGGGAVSQSGDLTRGSHDLGGGVQGQGEGEGEGEGLLEMTDLEALAKVGTAEELVSSSGSSDTDLTITHTSTEAAESSREADAATAKTTPPSSASVAPPPSSAAVSVFVAKYSYIPSEMSPNPNHEQELAITVGDYLYVMGDMDADGFYYSQLPSGEAGLVPSNFVEKVEDGDEGEGDSSVPRPARSRVRRVSDLQDIPELDEDVSSSSVSTTTSDGRVPPPNDLELKTQYVEDDNYCVIIQWSSPPSLIPPSPSPSSSSSTISVSARQQVTFHVYVNQEFKQAVGGVPGIMATELSDIPRHQLVKISVRTVTDEGESTDPKKIIILNPQYPEPPTKVQVSLIEESLSSPAILVEWAPGRVMQAGGLVSGYVIFLNGSELTHLLSSSKTPGQVLCATLSQSHLARLSLLPEERLLLTVRAVSDQYQSLDSAPVVLPRELFDRVVAGSNWSGGRAGLDSSSGGALVGGEERDSKTGEDHMTQAGGHVSSCDNHVTTNGHKLNGSMECASDEIDGARERIKGGPRYYIATFSYNPTFHSPNVETVDDELAFRDGDIITACSEKDEEGFFEGLLRGKRGLVPSNMVEQVTESEKLAEIEQLVADQQCRSPDPLSHPPTENGGDPIPVNATRQMRVLFGYNPAVDSPNENKDEELCIEEGDVVTVFGRPDGDGYYQGELKGKRGLVPSNFLEECKEGQEGEGEKGAGKRRNTGGLGMEIFAASEQDMEQAKRIIAEASDSLKRSGSLTSSADSSKHKKGIFAKGKELLSKGVGKK